MPYFNESQLEQAIIDLLKEQEYEYIKGENIVRDLDEVVLRDDLAQYLRNRYKNDGITEQEVESAIRVITQKQGLSLYQENKHTLSLLMDGRAPTCRSLDRPLAGADRENFQYYLIDGFIVSDNLRVEEMETVSLDFTSTDHNPVRLTVTLLDR